MAGNFSLPLTLAPCGDGSGDGSAGGGDGAAAALPSSSARAAAASAAGLVASGTMDGSVHAVVAAGGGGGGAGAAGAMSTTVASRAVRALGGCTFTATSPPLGSGSAAAPVRVRTSTAAAADECECCGPDFSSRGLSPDASVLRGTSSLYTTTLLLRLEREKMRATQHAKTPPQQQKNIPNAAITATDDKLSGGASTAVWNTIRLPATV